MEYQGANNWHGLLDPLDDALRSEIVRYGEFVQAAYTSFDFDPTSPSYATCRFPKDSLLHRSGLPSSGYRVTRNLHATSATRLPRWARSAPASLSRRSSWIGYVAVCQDEDEIARLGRRDVVIAFRGTATCLEWLENLRASLTHLPSPFPPSASQPDPMVQRGFWSLFTSPGSVRWSLRDEVRDEIARLLDAYGGKGHPLSLTVTGHSLGAALAVLTAYDITTTFQDAPMVTVVSFGGPRVGNASFRRRLEEQGSKVLRIVNAQDIITKVPGFVIDDGGNGKKKDGKEGTTLISWLLSKTGWVYADIGRELRLPGQRTANVVACHDLSVYLNLVNQLSANYPFRSLATQAVAGQR
uniref:Phospholipase A(1) DAD1, chloroplastic-like n=2 Tax=Elaeis guineensis var. tenera TaxID=51953 RepID=A0A6I9RYI3_ELAGV|nr:phospholipase A(1) DAD1, chloroplastic-like [Elaeis guineensis]